MDQNEVEKAKADHCRLTAPRTELVGMAPSGIQVCILKFVRKIYLDFDWYHIRHLRWGTSLPPLPDVEVVRVCDTFSENDKKSVAWEVMARSTRSLQNAVLQSPASDSRK